MHFEKLDCYQKKAVTIDRDNVLVVAPPGSGKTCVIINRLIYLVKEKKVSPKNIAVITFTKAATDNMKKRYENICKSKHTPFFGTFHSFCYRILYTQFKKIKLINEKEKYDLLEEILKDYINNLNEEKIKGVLNCISLYKNNNSKIEEINCIVSKEIFYNCYLEYENYKNNNGLLDFDDLQIGCRNILEKNNNILYEYRKKFSYILVDEFQDCDNIQINILRLLNKNNSLFAVGDEDQCIYGFRGSKPECMVNFNQYFIHGEKIFLYKNYRSGKSIVELSKGLIKNNNLRNNKKIISYNDFLGETNLVFVRDEKDQCNKICDSIRYLMNKKSYSYNDFAILYRRNIESISVMDNFLKNDIPFKLLQGQFNIYDHFIYKDIIAYLKLALNKEDKKSFIRIINRPFRYISKIIINKLLDNNVRDNCFDIVCNEDISIMNLKTIRFLERQIDKLALIPFKKSISYILNNIGYIDYIEYYSNKYKVDKEEFLYLINSIEECIKDFSSIKDFINYIKKVHNKNSSREEGVTISTIHGVKGMEFKNVFIINCNDGNIPYTKDMNSDMEEERRLFYVAITRAIENVIVFVPEKSKERYILPSRFINECNLSHNNVYEYKKGDRVEHLYLGKAVVDKVEQDKISLVFSNKMIRKFYTNIIKLNNLIKKE
ncbi:ATP-dependent helicase [Clostridium lundense]|uniref:ATP-dependent helicase n=1 Tax=Clostridium lundense TaxID=319475 RepID=UPI0004889CC4|nr:ATP-dependent helicase [Clostridium lundense]